MQPHVARQCLLFSRASKFQGEKKEQKKRKNKLFGQKNGRAPKGIPGFSTFALCVGG